MRVAEVVAVAAAELVERLGDVADAVLDEVAPRRAVVEAQRLGDRRVGVDQVAGVDEQVRLGGAHRGERAHAAVAFVDAPALPAHVAAPHDPHRRRRPPQRPRCRPERAAHRLAELAAPALEARLVDDPLARREPGQVEPGGEVGVGRRRRGHALARASQRVGRAVADPQPRRPVRAAPHDGPIELDVAGLHAQRDHRPGAGVAGDGRGGRQRGQGRARDRQPQEAAAGQCVGRIVVVHRTPAASRRAVC